MSKKDLNRVVKLTQKDFKIYHGDVTYFQKFSGLHNQYEIALEPCDKGFDVALYWHKKEVVRIGQKKCTDLPGYADDPFHQQPRSEETWKKALELADEIIRYRLPKGVEL